MNRIWIESRPAWANEPRAASFGQPVATSSRDHPVAITSRDRMVTTHTARPGADATVIVCLEQRTLCAAMMEADGQQMARKPVRNDGVPRC